MNKLIFYCISHNCVYDSAEHGTRNVPIEIAFIYVNQKDELISQGSNIILDNIDNVPSHIKNSSGIGPSSIQIHGTTLLQFFINVSDMLKKCDEIILIDSKLFFECIKNCTDNSEYNNIISLLKRNKITELREIIENICEKNNCNILNAIPCDKNSDLKNLYRSTTKKNKEITFMAMNDCMMMYEIYCHLKKI